MPALDLRRSGLPVVWGATPAEVATRYTCDRLLPESPGRWVRGVDSAAPAKTLFRWLCQLRVAPYSYDLVDNWARSSPRTLTPGTDELAVGQPVMTIFTLQSFEPGRELTVRMRPGGPATVFGDVCLTYVALDRAGGGRLLAVARLTDPPGPVAALRRSLLGWGDLLMMRKQLTTLSGLAERSVGEVG